MVSDPALQREGPGFESRTEKWAFLFGVCSGFPDHQNCVPGLHLVVAIQDKSTSVYVVLLFNGK